MLALAWKCLTSGQPISRQKGGVQARVYVGYSLVAHHIVHRTCADSHDAETTDAWHSHLATARQLGVSACHSYHDANPGTSPTCVNRIFHLYTALSAAGGHDQGLHGADRASNGTSAGPLMCVAASVVGVDTC